MRKIKSFVAFALLVLLVTTNAWAFVPDIDVDKEPDVETLNLPPVRIVNNVNDTWSVKVWAYPGWATEWQITSCQTLDYDFAWSRPIDPIRVRDPFKQLWTNHCGNYETLTFWFRAWNQHTGEYRDYSTFGIPAPWGATWSWDGLYWNCTGC